MDNNLYLSVDMRDKNKSFFKGTVFSVTSTNERGEFDVLPTHANFISLIRNYVILNKKEKDEKKFRIGTGVIRVSKNQVDIFIDV